MANEPKREKPKVGGHKHARTGNITTRHGEGVPGGNGWGGPRQGAGNHGPGPGRPTKEQAAIIAERREVNKATMLGVFVEVALNPMEHGMARVNAADRWLDREEGKVEQRNLNLNVNAERSYVVEMPRELESTEDWLATHAPDDAKRIEE